MFATPLTARLPLNRLPVQIVVRLTQCQFAPFYRSTRSSSCRCRTPSTPPSQPQRANRSSLRRAQHQERRAPPLSSRRPTRPARHRRRRSRANHTRSIRSSSRLRSRACQVSQGWRRSHGRGRSQVRRGRRRAARRGCHRALPARRRPAACRGSRAPRGNRACRFHPLACRMRPRAMCLERPGRHMQVGRC